MDKIPRSILKVPVENQKNDANLINTKKDRSEGKHNSKKVTSLNPVKLFINGLLKIKKSFSKSIHSRKVEPVFAQNSTKVRFNDQLMQSDDKPSIDSHIDEELTRYNQELKSSRINEELDNILDYAEYDVRCYKAINKVMKNRFFDKNLIKDKESDEIHAILLEHEIISPKVSEKLKKSNVDLEGSPYW